MRVQSDFTSPLVHSGWVQFFKRRHCQSPQSREDFTRANTWGFSTSCKQDQIRLSKTSKRARLLLESILWTAEIKINLYQSDEKKTVWRRLGTAHDQSTQHHLWSPEQCGASRATGLLVFSDDETEDTLLKIKLLHDSIEEALSLNGSIHKPVYTDLQGLMVGT